MAGAYRFARYFHVICQKRNFKKRHVPFLFGADCHYYFIIEKGVWAMEIFKELPLHKREEMELLFRNCTEEVKYHTLLMDVEEGRTFIKTGSECTHIFIILSGKVTGVEWPVYEQPYPFKDFGPGDFFGEIECFAGMSQYRICVVAATKCRVLAIPAAYYMEWMRQNVDALFLRTQENTRRLISQTAEARKYLFMDGKDRLMIHLIRKYEQRYPAPEQLELKQSHEQISENIAVSVKTLNRGIKRLEDLRLIQIQKGKIVITREGYRKMKEYIERHING